jgi:thiol-disulfide isomerase/thioredoxin
MNKAALITLLAMLFVVAAGAVYIFFLDESEKQKRNETPAANALLIEDEQNAYLDMSQSKVDFAGDIGKVLVVSSWASWCPQCAEDIGRLDQVASEFKDREVVFLAINRAENPYTAERFLNTFQKPQNVRIVLDPSDHFFASNAGYAMPETIVYDEDGEIKSHQRGNLNTDELKKAIFEALE